MARNKRELDKALAVVAPNRQKPTRAFTPNHPLWKRIIEMRNDMLTPWATILAFARERGHILTVNQIEYGFQRAGIEYVRHVTPWMNKACLEWRDRKFPALEAAMAALSAEADDIQRMADRCDDALAMYNEAEEPEARAALLATVIGLTNRHFQMLSRYLADLLSFRRAVGEALPEDVVAGMLGAEGEAAVAAKVLTITDARVFQRETQKLYRMMRAQMEVFEAAIKRGENVPEFRPLGPVDFIEGEAEELSDE